MTSKEALQELINKYINWDFNENEFVEEEHYKMLVETIERDLKVLEIITKGFNIWVEEIRGYKEQPIYRLVLCYSLSDRFYLNITKEQYDLLKEVLENDK